VRVGDEVETDGVRIRIEALSPVEAIVLAVSGFWASRPKPFTVGLRLRFRGAEGGPIDEPSDLPWFVLGTRDGKLYFEHYR
jgi:hypothetical protein